MIKNITKLFTITNPTVFRFNYSFLQKWAFSFSEQGVERSTQGENRAAIFYRNSIRRINVNEKGRGKFTQHNLLRLTKLMDSVDQQELVFEAYYNYLGHYTIIQNQVVDKMILKIVSFEGFAWPQLLELLNNHNYLGYFPSYKVTNTILELAQHNEESQQKLFAILMMNPLIKFNNKSIQILLSTLKSQTISHTCASTLIKLLIHRAYYKVTEEFLSSMNLLTQISTYFLNRYEKDNYKTYRRSVVVTKWLEQLIQQNSNSQILFKIAVVAFSSQEFAHFANLLSRLEGHQQMETLFKIVEASSLGCQKQVAGFVEKIEISETTKNRLQAVLNNQESTEKEGEGEEGQQAEGEGQQAAEEKQ